MTAAERIEVEVESTGMMEMEFWTKV